MSYQENNRTNKQSYKRWQAVPTWLIVTLLIIFFPVGFYLLWRQNRWSNRKKKFATVVTSLVLVAFIALVVIFAPPSVTVTSSLDPIKADSYRLTGKIYPSGSTVTINGSQAEVSGDTFSDTVPLTEGDNNLKVVIVNGSKRTEQSVTIHRYTKSEVTAQQKAAAQKKAAATAAQAKRQKASATKAKIASEKAKADAAKAKAAADAAAQAAKNKAAADAAAQAKAAAAAVTVSQKNALSKAKSYLSYTAFSHDGLVDQLVYDKFSTADATYGADNAGADWNAQAAKKAKSYMGYSSFSRGGLIDQLEYDKFTPDQATYGVNAVGL